MHLTLRSLRPDDETAFLRAHRAFPEHEDFVFGLRYSDGIGHIGYGVVPRHRRNGYATEISRKSLAAIRDRGVLKLRFWFAS